MNTLFRTIILLIAATAATVSHAELVLIDDGKANVTIVVAPDASEVTRRAANELQTFLDRMSGMRVPIDTIGKAAEGVSIFVGPSDGVSALGVDVPDGFTNQMSEEGYVIRTFEDAIVLAGNDDEAYRGTLYAVYDLLETLGCRWFFPGAYGEVVPRRTTIAIGDIDRVERPDFRFRNIWYSGWMPASETDRANYSVWMDRNRMNSLRNLSLPGDGSITRLAPAAQYFETHPEIYAINEKGERMKDMLCLTEPEAVRIAVKTITDEFRARPDARSFGFAPPDGHPRCFCDRCRKAVPGFTGKGFGEPSLSDLWFGFANEVAKEVYKEFPDPWLLTNGYANRVRPPEGIGKLSPNLGIQSAMIDSCTFHRIGDPHCWQRQVYEGVLDRWTRDLDCVFIYDYDPGKAIDGLPFPMLHSLSNDMRYYRDRGVWGFWTEGNNCWMVTHLNYYVRAKLMWDADADVKALVHDYCLRFYGDAARPIEDYIWTLEDAVESTDVHEIWGRLVHWQSIITPHVRDQLDRAIQSAESRAERESDRLHVHVLRKTHDNLCAYLDMEDAAAAGRFAEAVSHADTMLSIREELAKVDPALLPYTPEWCRYERGTPEFFKKMYQELADKTGGAKGVLVAMVPSRWEFKTDPEDNGVIYEWYRTDKGTNWDEISDAQYWNLQGYQDERGWGYAGKAWYRTNLSVPANASTQDMRLTFGGVYSNALWIWVNGELVDHRERQDTNRPFDVDVSGRIRPGETNGVAVLVGTAPADRDPRGGLYRRAFLWSPKAP